MKTGWQTKTLGEVIQLPYGKPLDPKDRNPNGLYPAYGANGEKDRTDKFYRDSPSIIVGRKGSAGEITLTEDRFWPLDVTYFVEFDRQHYDLQFLYYLLVTLDLPSLAKGVKPGINRNEVYALPVSLPPLPEQQRIVTLIDEVFDGIATARANAEQSFQNGRAIFDSVLDSVSGENAALGNYVTIKTGKLDANAASANGAYPFFTCAKEIYAIDNYAFDCEAILLAGNNAVGDFNVKHYKGKFNAYQRTYVITVVDENLLSYRFLYFQMLKSLRRFKEQSVGAGTKFLKIGMIKELEISLPSIAKQIDTAAMLDSLLDETQSLESIYQRKLAALDELKNSLLAQAFSGAL